MNYTREQAEEAKDIVKDVLKYYDVCMAGRKYKDFLDHKFPKKVSGWYKTEGSDKYLMYFDFENDIYYGFSSFGIWHSRDNSVDFESNSDYDYLATPQEVEQRLIEEAKRRGIIKGAVVANAVNGSTDKIVIEPSFRFTSYYSKEELKCDYTYYSSFTAFINGKWAEVIEQPETELTRTIKKAEKIAAKLENLLSSQRS
jgi:hypothetical protein